jgi:hypothetical protein
MTNLLMTGLALDLVGTVMLGYTVLSVHDHIRKEHRLDDDVYQAIKRERVAGFSGLFLICLGMAMQISVYFFGLYGI